MITSPCPRLSRVLGAMEAKKETKLRNKKQLKTNEIALSSQILRKNFWVLPMEAPSRCRLDTLTTELWGTCDEWGHTARFKCDVSVWLESAISFVFILSKSPFHLLYIAIILFWYMYHNNGTCRIIVSEKPFLGKVNKVCMYVLYGRRGISWVVKPRDAHHTHPLRAVCKCNCNVSIKPSPVQEHTACQEKRAAPCLSVVPADRASLPWQVVSAYSSYAPWGARLAWWWEHLPPTSVPVVGMWVEFDVGSLLDPRDFLLVLRFSSLHKNQHFEFQFDLDVKCLHMSPWLGRLGTYSLHYDVQFDLPFFQLNLTSSELILCQNKPL